MHPIYSQKTRRLQAITIVNPMTRGQKKTYSNMTRVPLSQIHFNDRQLTDIHSIINYHGTPRFPRERAPSDRSTFSTPKSFKYVHAPYIRSGISLLLPDITFFSGFCHENMVISRCPKISRYMVLYMYIR